MSAALGEISECVINKCHWRGIIYIQKNFIKELMHVKVKSKWIWSGFCSLKLNPVQTNHKLGILQYCHIKAFVTSDCSCFSFGLMCFRFFHWCGIYTGIVGGPAVPLLFQLLCSYWKFYFWPPQYTNKHFTVECFCLTGHCDLTDWPR